MIKLIVFTALATLCLAETPVSGPYTPSGWKPKGVPFTLPSQFLPTQQQRSGTAGATNVEVTQERVEYLGQLSETTTNIPEPNLNYLPAGEEPEEVETEQTSTENYIKVQGLPARNNAPNFNGNQQNTNDQFRLNKGELVRSQQQNEQLRQQLQQQNLQNEQLRQQLQLQQQNLQNEQLRQQQFNEQQQTQANFGRQVLPANQYGAPNNLVQGNQSENNDENDSTNQKNNDANVEEDTDDDEVNNDDQTNVPVVTNPVNSNGQYYILTPDNTLQRVMFMTSQNPEEARTNAFTAQLRYMPVAPIRDPIYSYNAEGQLIRIFKK